MREKNTKHLISEIETTELGGPDRKTQVVFDDITQEETTTNFVSMNGQWVTDSVNTVRTNLTWDSMTTSPNAGDVTITAPAWGTSTGSLPYNFTIGDTVVPSIEELTKLLPLVELVGKCVACGDDADVLLCAPCGVAVRELGRDKLRGLMKEMQEELS